MAREMIIAGEPRSKFPMGSREEGRWIVLTIKVADFLALLNDEARIPIDGNLPPDWRVIAVVSDPYSQVVRLRIEHPSFPLATLGALSHELCVEVVRRNPDGTWPSHCRPLINLSRRRPGSRDFWKVHATIELGRRIGNASGYLHPRLVAALSETLQCRPHETVSLLRGEYVPGYAIDEQAMHEPPIEGSPGESVPVYWTGDSVSVEAGEPPIEDPPATEKKPTEHDAMLDFFFK